MSLSSVGKSEIIEKYQTVKGDTGSTGVQVALLTERVSYLTEHFKVHKHDHHSRRGLLKMVSDRRRLLDYLKKKNITLYEKLIKQLGLRK